MRVSPFVGVLIIAVPVIIVIIRLRKQFNRQKRNQAAMESSMGRLNYIKREKTMIEQQIKLLPALLIMGIIFLVAGILLDMAGWRGIGKIYMVGILAIVVAIVGKFGMPKRIAELEHEIKYLQEAENNE